MRLLNELAWVACWAAAGWAGGRATAGGILVSIRVQGRHVQVV